MDLVLLLLIYLLSDAALRNLRIWRKLKSCELLLSLQNRHIEEIWKGKLNIKLLLSFNLSYVVTIVMLLFRDIAEAVIDNFLVGMLVA